MELPIEIVAHIAAYFDEHERKAIAGVNHAFRQGVTCIEPRVTEQNYIGLAREGRFMAFLLRPVKLPNYALALAEAKDVCTIRSLERCAAAEGLIVDVDEAAYHLFKRNPELPAATVQTLLERGRAGRQYLVNSATLRDLFRLAVIRNRLDIANVICSVDSVIRLASEYPEFICVSEQFPEWRPAAHLTSLAFASPFFKGVAPALRPLREPTRGDISWAVWTKNTEWIDYLCETYPGIQNKLIREMMEVPEVAVHVINNYDVVPGVLQFFGWLLSNLEVFMARFRNAQIFNTMKSWVRLEELNKDEQFAYVMLALYNGEDITDSLPLCSCGRDMLYDCVCEGFPTSRYVTTRRQAYSIMCMLVGYTPEDGGDIAQLVSDLEHFSAVDRLFHLAHEAALPQILPYIQGETWLLFPSEMDRLKTILSQGVPRLVSYWDVESRWRVAPPASCQVCITKFGAPEDTWLRLSNLLNGDRPSREAFSRLLRMGAPLDLVDAQTASIAMQTFNMLMLHTPNVSIPDSLWS